MGNVGDPEVLCFDMKLLDIVALVLMSNYEFSDLIKRDVVRPTSVVQNLSSADAKVRFERIRRVIQSCLLHAMRTRARS